MGPYLVLTETFLMCLASLYFSPLVQEVEAWQELAREHQGK